MDKEEQDAIKKRESISKVTLEIEKILLRENMSMGDFLEIVGLFTARANDVFSRISIKEIKEKHGKV